MKMTLSASEVMNIVLAQTATQLNVEPARLAVVMKAGGAADVYLDQAPDAPITRNRKPKAEAAVAKEAPVAVAEPVAAPVVEEVQQEMPFTTDEPVFVPEQEVATEVSGTEPAVGAGALWG